MTSLFYSGYTQLQPSKVHSHSLVLNITSPIPKGNPWRHWFPEPAQWVRDGTATPRCVVPSSSLGKNQGNWWYSFVVTTFIPRIQSLRRRSPRRFLTFQGVAFLFWWVANYRPILPLQQRIPGNRIDCWILRRFANILTVCAAQFLKDRQSEKTKRSVE